MHDSDDNLFIYGSENFLRWRLQQFLREWISSAMCRWNFCQFQKEQRCRPDNKGDTSRGTKQKFWEQMSSSSNWDFLAGRRSIWWSNTNRRNENDSWICFSRNVTPFRKEKIAVVSARPECQRTTRLFPSNCLKISFQNHFQSLKELTHSPVFHSIGPVPACFIVYKFLLNENF